MVFHLSGIKLFLNKVYINDGLRNINTTILTKFISSVQNEITNLRNCRITVERFVDPIEKKFLRAVEYDSALGTSPCLQDQP